MARIPVERRGGFPWWGWLLLALAVLALIALLLLALMGDDEEPELGVVDPEPTPTLATQEVSPPAVTPTPPVVAQGAETPQAGGNDGGNGTGPITDLTTIFQQQDKASLAGRRVNLQGATNAQVQSVVGDKTFWVGPSNQQQVFVVLSEEQDPAGVEGKVDVDQGQTVRLTGEVRQLPSMQQARQQWGLSEANTAQLQNQEIYIHAERVEIIER